MCTLGTLKLWKEHRNVVEHFVEDSANVTVETMGVLCMPQITKNFTCDNLNGQKTREERSNVFKAMCAQIYVNWLSRAQKLLLSK